jgi:hypothetical protein
VGERVQQNVPNAWIKLLRRFELSGYAPPLVGFHEDIIEGLGFLNPLLDHVFFELEE